MHGLRALPLQSALNAISLRGRRVLSMLLNPTYDNTSKPQRTLVPGACGDYDVGHFVEHDCPLRTHPYVISGAEMSL